MAQFFNERAKFPVFVTIQPNLASAPSPIKVAPGTPTTPANKTWAIVSTLFFRLDRKRTGCARPAILPPDERFQGSAILEKHDTNPHVHLLLRCHDNDDQAAKGEFLLEELDNVSKVRKDGRDEAWQRDVWEALLRRPCLPGDRTLSMMTPIAPAGTAMVQIVRTEEDLRQVCRYMAKSCGQTQHQLSTRAAMAADDPFLDWKELDSFHAEVDPLGMARRHRLDPITGIIVPHTGANETWKAQGAKVRASRSIHCL